MLSTYKALKKERKELEIALEKSSKALQERRKLESMFAFLEVGYTPDSYMIKYVASREW